MCKAHQNRPLSADIHMKSICVTGNSEYVINIVAKALEQLGVVQAAPSKNNSEMTMQSWLSHVYSTPRKTQDSKKIGKLWEKVLIDIFLTNHKKTLWQWNDKKSLLALDYFYEFDTDINFLIIPTSLADHIGLSLSAVSAYKDFDFKAEVDDWWLYTQHVNAMRTKEKVRIHYIDPRELTTANEAFKAVNLDVTEEYCAKTIDVHSSWSDPTFTYLAAQLEAALLKADRSRTNDTDASDEIAESIAALDFYIGTRFSQQGGSSDSPMLEPLPYTMDISSCNLSEKIEELESENDLILFQLHETQEEFEHYIQRSKLALKQATISELRLSKALDKHPEYWEYESLKAESIPGKNAIRWQIKDTYLKTYHCENLVLQTSGEGEKFTLSLFNGEHQTSPFFELTPSVKQVDFHLNNAKKDVPNPFSLVGPTDWDNLVFLIDRLIGWITSEYAAATLPKETISKTSLELRNVRKTLDKWPLTLRYDDIVLKEVVDVDNYKALGISLNNIRLGSESWQTLEFRVSTFSDGRGDSAAHPRLEFPESSRQAIQSWYPESNDDRGPRLELRFSKPNAMDTAVWTHLADADKLLIAALLTNLNIQLHKLETAPQGAQVMWREWHQIANFMRVTLAKIHQSAK